ncbi:unnamed protein product [Clavelina lepadiformis]|uniref:Uncharacterized protein n=1 Tax=Clavelina lepadiformis TaxID=159417 RepID=A0ABP0H0Q1_CLALP
MLSKALTRTVRLFYCHGNCINRTTPSAIRSYSNESTDLRPEIKRFNPSLGASGETTIITEKMNIPEPRTVEEIIAEKQQKRKESQQKVRKLYIWDKWILVKMGKYKQISDVPNKIVFRQKKTSKELHDQIRAEMAERGFKGLVGVEYLGWLICIGLCGTAYYAYQHSKKSDNTVISNEIGAVKT